MYICLTINQLKQIIMATKTWKLGEVLYNPLSLAFLFGVCLFISFQIITKNEHNKKLKEIKEEQNDLKLKQERFKDSINYKNNLLKLGVKH